MKQRGKNNWSPIPLDRIIPEYKRPSGLFGVRAGACILQNTVYLFYPLISLIGQNSIVTVI